MADIKENPKEAVELSQEELTAKRDEITKYYKDHVPHLEAQLEYEGLLRDIEKCRAERMQAQQFMSKMTNVPPTPPIPEVKKPVVNPANRQALEDFEKAKDATKSNEEEKKRTLKKTSKDA
jgi:phage terminase large subunit-like protein